MLFADLVCSRPVIAYELDSHSIGRAAQGTNGHSRFVGAETRTRTEMRFSIWLNRHREYRWRDCRFCSLFLDGAYWPLCATRACTIGSPVLSREGGSRRDVLLRKLGLKWRGEQGEELVKK